MIGALEPAKPVSTWEEDFQRKQKLLSRLAMAFSVMIAIFTTIIFILLPGIKPGKIIALLSVFGFALISRLSLRPDWYKTSAFAMVVLTMLAGFAGSLTNGGLEGYIAPIMITSPIAAALFLGTRATIISAVAVVISYAILLLIEPYGLVQPEPYPEDVTSIAALVLLAMATAFCAAGLGYFASDSKEKINSLIAARQQVVDASAKLRYAALHDTLTGIANRQNLQQHIDIKLRAAGSEHDQICVIHIDLDHFKEVNDTHGHPVGDGVLRIAAKRMAQTISEEDLVARIGGDEFVIVRMKSSRASGETVQALCEEIIDQINRPMLVNGIECHVGASIGYIISDRVGSSTESLIANADIALYESKRCGRGIARQFTGAMRETIETKRSLVSDLTRAFDEDRISCALQPQVCLQTGKLSGMEALGRIRHQDDGSIMLPAEFLGVMEDVGLVDAFDLRVLKKALDALVHYRAQGFMIPNVSVNASAKSLRSEQYVAAIDAELKARGLSADSLVVEVLESTLIEDRDDVAAKTIERLSASGIKTVIDDFGSGHASVWALLELKLDGVKIDRSLITNIDCDRSRTVVEAVLKLAKGLDLDAVVEGVETPQQYSALQSMGCDAAQGYGICKPLDVDAFGDWLDAYGRSEVARLQSPLKQSGLI